LEHWEAIKAFFYVFSSRSFMIMIFSQLLMANVKTGFKSHVETYILYKKLLIVIIPNLKRYQES